MQIDSESLLSDADMLSVLQRLPDVKLNLSRNYSPDGNKVQILCRYHADRNFGSANLLVHNGFKGSIKKNAAKTTSKSSQKISSKSTVKSFSKKRPTKKIVKTSTK